MIPPSFSIIDISQPISSLTACFPGDIPFSQTVTVDYAHSGVMNLTAFTMSPHVGTHADAPVHVHGNLQQPTLGSDTIGQLPLSPFIGPAAVLDLSPWTEAICWEQVEPLLKKWPNIPPRLLLKTQSANRYDRFQPPYAWPGTDLVENLAALGIVLIGIDTPSVDHVDSKHLETHHALIKAGIVWLENLDLTDAPTQVKTENPPFLIALPLKMMDSEASPVRAALLIPA
jgi:arylformamidase